MSDFNGNSLTVETGGGVREVFPTFKDGEMVSAKIAMGIPKFLRDEIPVNKDLFTNNVDINDFALNFDNNIKISCVNIGNPHAVLITNKDVDEFDLNTEFDATEVSRYRLMQKEILYIARKPWLNIFPP